MRLASRVRHYTLVTLSSGSLRVACTLIIAIAKQPQAWRDTYIMKEYPFPKSGPFVAPLTGEFPYTTNPDNT